MEKREIKRNLDGVYFRVKRNKNYENICFSDLSVIEREEICRDKPIEWLKKMLYIMTDTIKEIGDKLDIVKE